MRLGAVQETDVLPTMQLSLARVKALEAKKVQRRLRLEHMLRHETRLLHKCTPIKHSRHTSLHIRNVS